MLYRSIRPLTIGMGLLAAAAAPAMTVQEFLGTVDGLKAKGPFALFSSDIGKLKREGRDAVVAWHEQVAPPGRPRNACPPADFAPSDSDFMGFLQAVPPPQRADTTVAQAVTNAMNRRYPCRGVRKSDG